MNNNFGTEYSGLYDNFYHDKEYDVECDLIEDIFKKYAQGKPVKTILDLGCGTGKHAIPLAKRGYNVVGVDRSKSMLTLAQQKSGEYGVDDKIAWRQADIRDLKIDQQFDAVLMMFAVLGYQTTNSDVIAALNTARRHLSAGGLLIFDVWHGPAVLSQRPEQRMKTIDTENGRIIRFASGEIDASNHVCHVNYDLWQSKGDKIISETKETHTMRYFFPLELELFLENTAFSLVDLKNFPEFDKEPDETTWNVLCIARAVNNVKI